MAGDVVQVGDWENGEMAEANDDRRGRHPKQSCGVDCGGMILMWSFLSRIEIDIAYNAYKRWSVLQYLHSMRG